MPTLRALLTWLVLPLLILLLLPEILRLLPMLRDGLLYEWLRDLPWRYRAGFGLLLLLAIALPLLRRLQLHLDVLAARSLIPFWREPGPGPGSAARIKHKDHEWLVTLSPAPGSDPAAEPERSRSDRPPEFTAAPAGTNRPGTRARRRFEELLRLAWYLERDLRDRGKP